MQRLIRHVHQSEEGHVTVAVASIIAAAGVVLIAVGAANETDWLTIAGGIAAAIGLAAAHALRHRDIDWEVYRRLDDLEKRQ